MHLIIEHSAYLIEVRGPLGYWNQQGFEAAHKLFKEAYSRSTNHDGGRGDRGDAALNAPAQVVLKHGRMLWGQIRKSLAGAAACVW